MFKLDISPLFDTFGSVITSSGTNDILKLDREKILDLYKSSGLILFRGFKADVDTFKKFSDLYGSEFMRYVGGAYVRDMINGQDTVLAVTRPEYQFKMKLHGEMYYQKTRPETIWFFCDRPANEGGETTVGDGVEIYQRLSPSTKSLFQSKRLKYVRKISKSHWIDLYQTSNFWELKSICEKNDIQVTLNQDESIKTEYVYPGIVKSKYAKHNVFINSSLPLFDEFKDTATVKFEDNTLVPSDVVSEITEIAEKVTKMIRWQEHDILMIDNTRIMHGRNSFSDMNRAIYTRLALSTVE